MRTQQIRIRVMTRDDGATVDAVFAGLSAQSRYLRFHTPMPRLPASMRTALLDLDGRRRLALAADVRTGDTWLPVGIARLADIGGGRAELALAVVDAWQHRGIGRRLLAELTERAAALGYRRLVGDVLPENRRVVQMLRRAFPGSAARFEDDVVRVHCPIGAEVSHEDLLAALAS